MKTAETIKFLKQLKQNNNKEWFDAHKAEYQNLRKDWINFITEIIKGISAFDADVAKNDPAKCIFRINRDVRFSKDKSPYKTNFGASISKTGEKNKFCGYYIHISPDECFFGGGVYMPEPDALQAIRQEIDYHFSDFEKILKQANFKKYFTGIEGEKLSRPPKGYDAENPAIEYIKQKHFIATYNFSMDEVTKSDWAKQIVSIAKAVYPLNTFLYEAIK